MKIINKPKAPEKMPGVFKAPPTFRERWGRSRRVSNEILATPEVGSSLDFSEMMRSFEAINAQRMAQDNARLRATVTGYTAGQRLDPRSFDPPPEYVYGTGRLAPTRMWQIEPTQAVPRTGWYAGVSELLDQEPDTVPLVTPEEVEETSRW
jgi:hypothetical protein